MAESTPSIVPSVRNFDLITNPEFMEGIEDIQPRSWAEPKSDGFRPIETVDVHLADGEVLQEVPSSTTAFEFRPTHFSGASVVLTIERAHHIMSIHMKGEDSGSLFVGHQSLQEIMGRLSLVLPPEVSSLNYDREATPITFEDQIGWDGLAAIDDLVEKGVITDCDRNLLDDYRRQIIRLNLQGNQEEKDELVKRFNAKHAGIFLRLVRPPANVIIPHVVAETERTHTATLATTSRWHFLGWKCLKYINSFYPSRPVDSEPIGRHPIPGEHRDKKTGSIDMGSFNASAWSWSTHALLVPNRD